MVDLYESRYMDLLRRLFTSHVVGLGYHGRPPFVAGIKMHDNDFFAEDSAWTTVYLAKGARQGPPWNTALKSAQPRAERERTQGLNLVPTLTEMVRVWRADYESTPLITHP